MSSKIDLDSTVLASIASHDNKFDRRVVIFAWFGVIGILFTIVGSLYLGIKLKTLKKAQIQQAQTLQTLQQQFKATLTATTALPDNLEAVLQDIGNELHQQKEFSKTLESVMVSEVRPRVELLLQELSAIKQAAAKPSLVVTDQDWQDKALLAKVLGLAEIYAVVLQDSKHATLLLSVAEQIVLNSSNSSWQTLSASIAKDRQTLAALNLPNQAMIEQIFARLLTGVAEYAYQTTGQVKNLAAAKPEAAVAAKATATAGAPIWQQAITKTWQRLTTLVKVTHHQESLATLFESAESMQRERLKILLEQARLANLRQDAALFAASLQMAQDLLTEKFCAKDALTSQALADLTTLKQLKLAEKLPQQLKSFAKFKKLSLLVTEQSS